MPRNEFGDFQTPVELAQAVFSTLPSGPWGRLLEPTCGTGNFLQAAKSVDAGDVLGIEVQPQYAAAAEEHARVLRRNIFDLDLGSELSWQHDGPMLVVGNPPWVTNADLSRFSSSNRPIRTNIRKLRGIDAMTGASNFDIAEYIWLKLLIELQHHEPVISLLCKTHVARNVLGYCEQYDLPVAASALHRIDSRKWFETAVDACLFTVEVGNGPGNYMCDLYENFDDLLPTSRFGFLGGRLIADIPAYERSKRVEGVCPLEWRQGIKHDASSVMELVDDSGTPRMRNGQPVEVESEYLYPLFKGTDIFHGRTTELNKWMVVPQRTLGEDTSRLERVAPRLWGYLSENSAVLDGRKSSIYRNRPRFCVFGVGDYSFMRYKVAVSGLHKLVGFRVLGPIADKAAVLDDTCYFLPFDNSLDAAVVGGLLQSSVARDLLSALLFVDSKRPVTKKLLQRIDLRGVAQLAPVSEVVTLATQYLDNLAEYYSEADIEVRIKELSEEWSTGRESEEEGAARSNVPES